MIIRRVACSPFRSVAESTLLRNGLISDFAWSNEPRPDSSRGDQHLVHQKRAQMPGGIRGIPASKKGDPSDLIEACVLQRIWDEAWLNWSVQGESYDECTIPYDGAREGHAQ